MSDVLDILDAGRPSGDAPPVAKRGPKPKPPKPPGIQRRKPEGMHRELFALLNTSDADAPLLPTDFPQSQTTCYKQVRANLSIKKPRRWLWTPFLNPARKDHLQLNHWRRVTDPNEPPKEYQFAQYNVKIDQHIPRYDDIEYNNFLICDQWTKEETDYLMELCTKFDLRFNVINDRWDRKKYPTPRVVEDLKERYYFVYNQLAKARTKLMEPPKLKEYDSQHERKRKQQLVNLYNRTEEQIKEEENLINEMKKIEQKKKERERKTQDLQKIMDAAGRSMPESKRSDTPHQPQVGRPSGSGMRGMPGRRPGRGAGRPSRDSLAAAAAMAPHIPSTSASLLESQTLTIKFPDFKTSGSSLRSQRLKLPTSLGTKKMKALEQMIQELGLDQFPMPTESICSGFNELRGDLLLLYELKVNLANTDFEIQSIKNQLAAVGKTDLLVDDATSIANTTAGGATAKSGSTTSANLNQSGEHSETSSRDISDVIDLNAVNTPGRKRKAALEQSNVLRKLKKTL